MTHDDDFKKGDRVQAKTGGPTMTVEEVYDKIFHYRYRCAWLDGDSKPKSELFRKDELRKADD